MRGLGRGAEWRRDSIFERTKILLKGASLYESKAN